jgi:hypothetical protein
MDPGPLVKEQIDSGATFLAELDKKMPVATGFWLKGTDRDYWKFYVVADRFEGDDRRAAYEEVSRVTAALRDPNLGPLDLRLIEPSDPLAKAVLDYRRLYPDKVIRLRDRFFGGMAIDEVYIYPSPVLAAPVTS